MLRWFVGSIAFGIVVALAMFAGSMFPDRAIKVSANGFELSPPDVAKCQTEAKLLSDSLTAVAATVSALTNHAATEATIVGNLRIKYLNDDIYEPYLTPPPFTTYVRNSPSPRRSDYLPKAASELETDRGRLDAALKQQTVLVAEIADIHRVCGDHSGSRDVRPR
jgi:hypothetical protein